VGIFAPLKGAWRTVLSEYKQSRSKQVGIDKCDFPQLLKKTLVLGDVTIRHLPAALEKCGLFPVNKERAVERIPNREMKVETEPSS